MTYSPVDLLTVYFEAGERRKVGRLALHQRKILFEYDPLFLASGIEISPFKLPLQAGIVTPSEVLFDGLFGVFNDSLPDGWGRLLLDRTVEKHGLRRGQLNALDRLAFVGRSGMGALSYEPDRSQSPGGEEPLALDRLAEESAIMLAGETEEVFEELLRLSGSSAGARPKIVAHVSADKKTIIHGESEVRSGYEPWLIKFASSQDPRDVGAVEYAYSLMARDAGIEMPATPCFEPGSAGTSEPSASTAGAASAFTCIASPDSSMLITARHPSTTVCSCGLCLLSREIWPNLRRLTPWLVSMSLRIIVTTTRRTFLSC